MQHIMKIRPAWKRKTGEQGGSIISIPASVLNQINARLGDSLSISVEDRKIVMKKIVEVQGSEPGNNVSVDRRTSITSR